MVVNYSTNPYYWRTFETADEYFDYYRDYHAFWKIYGLDLPDPVLKSCTTRMLSKSRPPCHAVAFPNNCRTHTRWARLGPIWLPPLSRVAHLRMSNRRLMGTAGPAASRCGANTSKHSFAASIGFFPAGNLRVQVEVVVLWALELAAELGEHLQRLQRGVDSLEREP